MFRHLVGLALAAAATLANAQQYAQRPLDIRAGIVIIDSAQVAPGVPGNPTPHVWFNLDRNQSTKPAAWAISNPNGVTQASPAMVQRWTAIAGVVGGRVPSVGERVTKADAPYWEVRLSQLSDAQMAQYDVLLLNAQGFTSLNSVEREKLRGFMDRGGILWVEVAGANLDVVNNFPIPFQFRPIGGGGTLADFYHPLLSFPFAISAGDLNSINTGVANGLDQAIAPASIEPIESTLFPDWYKLKIIASRGGVPTIAAGKVGNGFMMVTCQGVAQRINQAIVSGAYSPNNTYEALKPTYDRSCQAAMKLVINMINLASSYPEPGAGSRKSGSTFADLTAPALLHQSFPIGLTPGATNYFPPAAFKGLLVFTGSDNCVYVLDASPNTDLDGDGNPDDGVQDYSLGATYDLLWKSAPLPGPVSAPTCIEVPNSGTLPSDQIVVVDGAGNVDAFDAFQIQNGRITGSTSVAPSYTASSDPTPGIDSAAPGHGPYAATYHEGLLYIADLGQPGFGGSKPGHIWIVDPSAGTALNFTGSPWAVGGTKAPVIPEISGSPTVGYVPVADNSGGLDKVVYVPTRPGGAFSPNATAGIYSLWFGVKGESPPPSSITPSPGLLVVSTRASRQGLEIYVPPAGSPGSGNATAKALGVKVTVIKSNGDPLTTAEMSSLFSGSVTQNNGQLSFGLIGAWDNTYSLRLDYTIDWGTGNSALTGMIVRGQVFFPDDQNLGGAKRRVIGNVAMSPRGTIYAVVSTQNDPSGGAEAGGSFYALREEGRGAFRMLTRYDLYGPHNIALNQTTPTTYPATFGDADGVTMMAPMLAGPFQLLTYEGGPTVRGDTVFVTARGRKSNGIPNTVIMAFKAEPEAAEIRTGNLGDNFTILQPDVTRSPNKTNPNVYTILQPGQYVYEHRAGADYGTIRIDNLMSTNRGPIANALSTSQPIIIRRANQPDMLLEPGNFGSRWSPLLWYAVLHAQDIQSAALVTGDTLFTAGSSGLPSFLSGLGFVPVGVLNGMKAEISPTDPFLRSSDASRPWIKQLLRLDNSGGFTPDTFNKTDFLWPQAAGVASFQDFLVRLRQTILPGSTAAYGVVGGEGNLLSWSDVGVYSFTRADFLVADEGRLARFDPSGNPIWTSDMTTVTGNAADAGTAATLKPLIRPVRAYRMGQNEIVAVDPGSNRVARFDMAGQELRTITGFRLDPTNPPPDGYTTNEPLTLDNPRDVVVFTSYEANPTGVANPQPLEFWYHYVIADSGNRRLIELIDRYYADPATRQVGDAVTIPDAVSGNPVPQLGVLIWHSPSNLSGKRYNYNSVARTFVSANGRYEYIAGVGGALPTRVDTGLDQPTTAPQIRESAEGNGGIVVFDPFDPKNNVVINRVDVPAVGANVYWDPVAGSFSVPAQAATVKSLSNLTSVSVTPNGNTSAIMFTDATGAYEIVPGGSTGWTVRWMMPNRAYRVMRWFGSSPVTISGRNPRDLNAVYARRLDSGEILLVNTFAGTRLDGSEFNGEVIQVDGDIDTTPTGTGTGFGFGKVNLGFDAVSVRFELPPVQGARGIVLPVFADRR